MNFHILMRVFERKHVGTIKIQLIFLFELKL